MKMKKFLSLIGILGISVASVGPLSAWTVQQRVNEVSFNERDFNSSVIIERVRQENILMKYGITDPIFSKLKRPNTWENLWYDILLVNGYEDVDFSEHDIQQNLNNFRQTIRIDDETISDTYGEIVKGDPLALSESIQSIKSFKFENPSNLVQTFLTNEITHETSTSQEWSLQSNFSFKFSAGMRVKFFGSGASMSSEVKFGTNTGLKSTRKDTVKTVTPSQTIKLEPKTKMSLNWIISDTTFKVPSGIQYQIEKPYNDDDLVFAGMGIYNKIPNDKTWKTGGKFVGLIDIDRSLWLIANRGRTNYLTDNMRDLFIISKTDTLPPYSEHTRDLLNPNSVSFADNYVFNIPLEIIEHGLTNYYKILSEPLN